LDHSRIALSGLNHFTDQNRYLKQTRKGNPALARGSQMSDRGKFVRQCCPFSQKKRARALKKQTPGDIKG